MDKKWWILIGTGIAAVIIAIDFSIVNTSLANIQNDLNASISQLQWVMAGFGLSVCTLMITMGRLGDILGRRKILYLGIIGFCAASLGAGFSMTPLTLIVMRILQGFFSAAILPCGMAITASAFPAQERGRALGAYGSILGIGLAFGPVLGSIINSLLNWRWIFFINVPIVILSLSICVPTIQESKLSSKVPVDWLGALFLMTSLGGLTFAINEGGFYGWLSIAIISAAIITLVSFICLFFVEKRSKAPIIPIHLLLNSGFLLALIVYLVSVSFAWPVLFLMPLYLHNIVGYTTEISGLILASMTIMTAIAPAVAGYFYDKKSKVMTIHVMFALSAASLIMFGFLDTNGPLWLIIVSFILFGSTWGIGNGIAIPMSLSRLSNANDAGLVSGVLTTAMNIFGVLSLTIISTLFRYKDDITFLKKLGNNAISIDGIEMNQLKIMLSTPEKMKQILNFFPSDIGKKILLIYKESFMSGTQLAYGIILTVILIFWIVASIIMKSVSKDSVKTGSQLGKK